MIKSCFLKKQNNLWLLLTIITILSVNLISCASRTNSTRQNATSTRTSNEKQVPTNNQVPSPSQQNNTTAAPVASTSKPLRNLCDLAPSTVRNFLCSDNNADNNNKALAEKRQDDPSKRQYAVVIDCGSSGSRARIYYWPVTSRTANNSGDPQPPRAVDQIKSLIDPNTNEVVSMKVKPGISKYGSNPEAASDYLRPLMQFLSSKIPANFHKQTPVYIMATAGMRLLKSAQQEAIWADIQRDVRREFPQFPKLTSEIISGTQEGAFQWLSVNALAKRLGSGDDYNQKKGLAYYLQASSSRRYAITEIGGASAQVTFEITSHSIKDNLKALLRNEPEALRAFDESRVKFEFDKQQQQETRRARQAEGDKQKNGVSLFSTTFLGFGSDSVRLLAVDLLVRDSLMQKPSSSNNQKRIAPNSIYQVDDPCLTTGSHELIEKPIGLAKTNSNGQTKTIGYSIDTDDAAASENSKKSKENFTVKLVGRGNSKACRQLLTRMISIAKNERFGCKEGSNSSCVSSLIGTEFVPWFGSQFIGMGELYYTSDTIFNTTGEFDGPKFLQSTQRLCSRTFDQVNMELKPKNDFEKRRNLLACFKANWIITWLADVLKMRIDTRPFFSYYDLTVLSKLGPNGEQVDWTLGAVIDRQLLDSASSKPLEIETTLAPSFIRRLANRLTATTTMKPATARR